MSEYSLDGQENIIKALESGDLIKLWKEVQYVGCTVVNSPSERKLIFYTAYNTWDRERNNSFLAYYQQLLNYANINAFEARVNPLKINKGARKNVDRRNVWPTREDKDTSQSENIYAHWVLQIKLLWLHGLIAVEPYYSYV